MPIDGLEITAVLSLLISGLTLLMRTLDKNLSIREHEAYKDAVARDISRIETRILHIEQTRPTSGELQIIVDVLGKRIDHMTQRPLLK